MKKRVFALAMAAVMGLSMSATVFAEAEVANKDKPLVWFNRQPYPVLRWSCWTADG